MAAGVPPPPLNSPSGSYYWLEWYTNLTNFLNGTNIPWSNINFSGSNISDIINRAHNSLTKVQGGTASSTAVPSGNAFHLMGYGFVSNDAATNRLPSGWTAVVTSGGVYTITHNLNLTIPNYMAGATSASSGSTVTYCDLTNPNTLVVHLTAAADFSFWIGTLNAND